MSPPSKDLGKNQGLPVPEAQKIVVFWLYRVRVSYELGTYQDS
jgi:hypothetical protein